MPNPIGIDLGTTESSVCVWRRSNVEIIPVDGRPTMPSAISVRPDGTVLVGQAARARGVLEPQQAILSARRYLGNSNAQWNIGGRPFTVTEALTQMLKRLKVAAEAFLGHQVQEAVVAVPACLTLSQRREVAEAARGADLNVLQLLPESTAAAIAYGLGKNKDQLLLLYDMGGGTFDVSILQVRGNNFEVKAVDGDFHLGGDDFDAAIALDFLHSLEGRAAKFADQLREGLTKPTLIGSAPQEVQVACRILRNAAERARIELSQSPTASVAIDGLLGGSLEVQITAARSCRLLQPLVERSMCKVRDVLLAARCGIADIDRVIAIGGMARSAFIRECLAAEIKETWVPDQTAAMVAQGAAMAAAHLSAPEQAFPDMAWENRLLFPVYVQAEDGRGLDRALASRNATLPIILECSKVTTRFQNQTSLGVSLREGRSLRDLESGSHLAFRVEDIPPAPAGDPEISLHLVLDPSGLLSTTAMCRVSGRNTALPIKQMEGGASAQAEIIFLLDTSGGMHDEVKHVKLVGERFSGILSAAGVTHSLGLMDFDLPYGASAQTAYHYEVIPPVLPDDFSAAVAKLSVARLGGCGSFLGDRNTVPIVEAFATVFSSAARIRVGVLISDEAGDSPFAIRQLVQVVRESGVRFYAIGVGGSCHETLAAESGGRFWDIDVTRGQADFLTVMDEIATDIACKAPSKSTT